MTESKKIPVSPLIWWRNTFFAGLFIVIPVVVTYWILRFLYNVVSAVTDPLVQAFVSYHRARIPDFIVVDATIPGAALIITLLLVSVTGLVATNVIGSRLVAYLEAVLHRIPLINVIYPVAKQVVDSLKSLGASGDNFEDRQAVYIKYPAMNGYLLGFLTGRFSDSEGRRMGSVFIPTAPNPISGFVVVFEEDQIITSNLSMDEAWKMVVSGGLIVPDGIVPAPIWPTIAKSAMPAIPGPKPAGTTRTV